MESMSISGQGEKVACLYNYRKKSRTESLIVVTSGKWKKTYLVYILFNGGTLEKI